MGNFLLVWGHQFQTTPSFMCEFIRSGIDECLHQCLPLEFFFCYYYLAKTKQKTSTTIMHKIRTLFLSRNNTGLGRWRG